MAEQFKRYDYEDPAAYGGGGQITLVDRFKARPLAWMNDKDLAQLLVDLLNKHEKFLELREQIKVWMANPANALLEEIDFDD